MAVKIVRQPKKIALIGAPSSAAAFLAGGEKAPAALRAAGLVDRLKSAGYEVIDHGDCAPRLFADDEEHRRARNLTEIVAGLNDLKTRAEVAIKSGALVLVLGGDCAQVIGLLTASRRYYKRVNLLWFDRDADLNTPATTPSGRIDGMVVAHIIGRGAPELVRFWGETPLVREPDVVLFGLERVDPPEQEFLTRSPMRHVYAADILFKGGAKSASEALGLVHADAREFVLHLDTDVIAQEDFAAVNVPGSGGLRFEDVRAALKEIVRHKNLVGLDVAQYNPDKDPDGSAAKKLVDLIVEALTARLESSDAPAAAAPAADAPVPDSAASDAIASEAPDSDAPEAASPASEPFVEPSSVALLPGESPSAERPSEEPSPSEPSSTESA
ncbi:MAG TPA: arginase family protein [Candidatus Dormibacteraeota bacterium]|nr:arginase family protein [Candidatus Dormibacteraeota bacterium]